MYSTKNDHVRHRLPNFTFFDWIHFRSYRAIKIFCKRWHIANRTNYTEFLSRMLIG